MFLSKLTYLFSIPIDFTKNYFQGILLRIYSKMLNLHSGIMFQLLKLPVCTDVSNLLKNRSIVSCNLIKIAYFTDRNMCFVTLHKLDTSKSIFLTLIYCINLITCALIGDYLEVYLKVNYYRRLKFLIYLKPNFWSKYKQSFPKQPLRFINYVPKFGCSLPVLPTKPSMKINWIFVKFFLPVLCLKAIWLIYFICIIQDYRFPIISFTNAITTLRE